MNKIAIVGSGTETRDLAPFGDKDFDIWIFNEAGSSDWCKRFDAVFQMHKPEIYRGHNTKDANHWGWLQQRRTQLIYMQEIDPLVPNSVRYPIEDAIELAEHKYLSATICYSIALALLQNRPEIHIWGVELSMTEYQYQAECIRFWVGLAQGKLGKDKVVMHSGLKLFDAPLYGYEGNFYFGKDFFLDRVRLLDNEWTAYEKNAVNIRRVIEKVIERGEIAKLPDLVSRYQVAMQNTGEAAGSLAEAERYAAFGDNIVDRGGFEFAGATAQRDGEGKRVMMFSKIGLIEYLANKGMNKELIAVMNEYGKLAEAYGAMLGIYKENVSYIIKYDKMVQANGGLK